MIVAREVNLVITPAVLAAALIAIVLLLLGTVFWILYRGR
jgi:hypothetical protein